VANVTVRGNATHLKQLAKQEVQTMLDAQFSLPYGFAAALSSGGAMLDQYTPEALRRPEVLDLARRVTLVLDEGVEEGGEPFLDIALRDGRTLTRRIKIARGDCLNPLSEEELRAKFRTAARLALAPDQIERLERMLAGIADLADVRELAALLTPQGTRAAVRAVGGVA
jgi:2-methylcitrate dehydratase PrpD